MNLTELLKPAAALLAVTVIAAILLGYVHRITKEPIAAQRERIEAEAIGAIFNTAIDKSDEVDVPEDSPVKRAIRVYSGNKLLGCAVFTSPTGYSGPVDIVVGIGMDGVVRGVRILRHAETPGLGANADNPAFTDQYKGKGGTLSVTKATPGNNEIQAITSATITSNAVTRGVNDALSFFYKSVER